MWDFFENLHLGTQNGPIFGHSSVKNYPRFQLNCQKYPLFVRIGQNYLSETRTAKTPILQNMWNSQKSRVVWRQKQLTTQNTRFEGERERARQTAEHDRFADHFALLMLPFVFSYCFLICV